MEPYVLLPRTLRRLERAADAQGLARSDVLDPALLAARTAPPESTVRDPRSVVRKLEDPGPDTGAAVAVADPVAALLDRYGVVSADLRLQGSVPRARLERLLEGVLRSVLPQEPLSTQVSRGTRERRKGDARR